MKAVIMAGGKGTRLRPLTARFPKPMVQLLGRPCIEYTLQLLKEHGITEIAITIQYLSSVIRDYLGDGSKYGVRLHYFEEHKPMGTAGGVLNAKEFLDERFLVISGDALTDFNLSEAMAFHENKRALATIILTQVESPCDFGVVLTQSDGKILRFLEKPKSNEIFTNTVNTGIYVFEKEILNWIPNNVSYDFGKELFPRLVAENVPFYGYSLDGYWSDVGSLHQYRQTQIDMLSGKTSLRVGGEYLGNGVWMGQNVQLHTDVKLNGPAFIGDGTIIQSKGQIGPYTVIGHNTMIGKSVQIANSIVWNKVEIGDSSVISGSMLGDGTKIEPGVILLGGTICASEGSRGITSTGKRAGWSKSSLSADSSQLQEFWQVPSSV
ncbi:sugar phosphate nucleotidyltransferase [Alicyclobacillus tolerans]|uniref:sugar phosphate nucleotidyltransferase n=1 Tax=Alicyclobacillus tolerans TaxID=90970 RepID=UPI003B778A44